MGRLVERITQVVLGVMAAIDGTPTDRDGTGTERRIRTIQFVAFAVLVLIALLSLLAYLLS